MSKISGQGAEALATCCAELTKRGLRFNADIAHAGWWVITITGY